MKYLIKLENITLTNDLIKTIEINVLQEVEKSYVNDKNRVEIKIEGELFTRDNGELKNEDLISKIYNMKDKYFDVNISIDSMEYKFPKLYIYKLNQNFNREGGKFNLILMQKFLGDEKIMEVITNEN